MVLHVIPVKVLEEILEPLVHDLCKKKEKKSSSAVSDKNLDL